MSAPLPIEQRGGTWVLQVHGTDVWCTSKGTLLMIRGKLLESGQGPLLPVAGFTRLYWPGGKEAHLAHPAGLGIFCQPDVDTESMRGTANQAEIDRAAKLLLCADCRRWSRAIRVLP